MPTATILLLPPQSTLFFPSKRSFTIPSTKLNHHNFHHYQKLIPKSSPSQNESTPPETEYPVPLDQQPINEFKSLSKSFPFSWASGDFDGYCSRLAVTGAAFALFVGLPVAWFGANGPESEPLKRVFEAISSGILVVIFVVVWMYLGWAYLGNRLVSPTVEYEEAGYDGQKIWVKTAEALARDRYLGSLSISYGSGVGSNCYCGKGRKGQEYRKQSSSIFPNFDDHKMSFIWVDELEKDSGGSKGRAAEG